MFPKPASPGSGVGKNVPKSSSHQSRISHGARVDTTDTIIIGAGPHGLAAAAHLRRSGVECRVFGVPMDFWKTMPIGALLR